MTQKKSTTHGTDWKALLAEDADLMRELVRHVMQEILEAEMTEALGAAPGERTEARLGYRAGYYPRTLVTRVGKLELRVPRDRDGRFSTELFERYQRSEKALVSALAEMYVQGVSTRKVKAITEELCGTSFSASTISAINKTLDATLLEFARRRLEEPYPFLIVDARYEKVTGGRGDPLPGRLDRHRHQPGGVPPGAGGGTRQPGEPDHLAGFLLLPARPGPLGRGVRGLRRPRGPATGLREILPEAAWQRCYVHFLRNALDHMPRKADDDCLKELRWLYDRRNLAEAERDLAAWLARWQGDLPRSSAIGWRRTSRRPSPSTASPANTTST